MSSVVFSYSEDFYYEMLIDGEDCDLQDGHDEELNRAGFTQDGPKGDQDCSCAEVCINHPAGQGRKKQHSSSFDFQQPAGQVFDLLSTYVVGDIRT